MAKFDQIIHKGFYPSFSPKSQIRTDKNQSKKSLTDKILS